MPRLRLHSICRLLVGLALAGLMLAGPASRAEAQTVTTPGGTFPAQTYKGASAAGISSFLGIRFAAPPTGSLRFAPPAAPAASGGTVSATAFGSACPQSASPFGTASSDEDCLFLNVYVPGTVSAKNKLPVMVFFYGGAFVDGEGSLYDPSAMALQGDTIVVTMNYRLGILGYMADAALSATAKSGVSGNYGLLDQQFALRWVQQNIAAFGGNARNVTIFGESAGGFSVCASIVSPAATGLFQRAITESGPCASPLPTLAGAEANGAAIVTALGCSDATSAATVACLRDLPVSAILTEQANVTATNSLSSLFAFFPNVDGVLIPQQPVLALALGEYNHVPVIEGTNHDEGRLFVAIAFDLNPAVGPLTAAEYPAAVQSIAATLVSESAGLLGGASSASSSGNASETMQLTNEILNEYPLRNFAEPGEALAAILTDGGFACPANVANELFSLSVPTFAYELNDENAPMLFLPPVSFPYGATHTDELQFLFAFAGNDTTLSKNEQTLAKTMKGYWTNFAGDGNPNAAGLPAWAPLSILTDNVQSLTPPTPMAERTFSAEHNCLFWTALLEQTIFASVASELKSNGITQ